MLIPFSSADPQRKANFDWLQEYWKYELPEVEVVIGTSKSEIFCKAEAINDAARRSRGKILVIMDADAYMDGNAIRKGAELILRAKNNLWLMPYKRLYRLNEGSTKLITNSRPTHPYRFPRDIDRSHIENSSDSIYYGHIYGAMAMMFPREAYETIGRMDERFKGWGGEDVCLLRALDTLFAKHKIIDADIFHLWHPFYGDTYESRRWAGQENGGSNWKLSKEYGKAIGSPAMMRKIVSEGAAYSSGTAAVKDPLLEMIHKFLGI
jgi:glycosyltransferase involved in cell wall biosynthesis